MKNIGGQFQQLINDDHRSNSQFVIAVKTGILVRICVI